ncbi:CRISPR system precrRNA processing endoribonuclease RAMP protein Cas6 [candidate division KSB1 bacterium]|nr:CRISPR system precrRNA processing endoribonuclease RAMP protein Cas6 [candidate division KSB1 bacterium]
MKIYDTWTLAEVFDTVQSWASDRLRLEFLTPTRMRYHNQLISQLNFETLIRTLVRRISLLGRVHCQSNWELPYAELIESCKTAAQIESSQLQWRDWERFSNRQQRRMKLGGVVGQVTYQGAIQPFLPLVFPGPIYSSR